MKQNAFSLVELSIVLVILGLLTGGILAGQSLIRAAELRSVSTEMQRFVTATQAFRDKYFALPGDMTNGVSFWNRHANQTWCLPTSGATVAAPGTCNGNGDNMIDEPAAVSQSGERYQFWRQLALAGLIEGEFTGLATATSTGAHAPGTNVPAGRISGSGWSVGWRGEWGGVDGSAFAGSYDNYFMYSAFADSTGNVILRPEEAWNIDTKMDDGRPARGKVRVRFFDTCTDAGSGVGSKNDLDADYLLSSSIIGCGLYFPQAF